MTDRIVASILVQMHRAHSSIIKRTGGRFYPVLPRFALLALALLLMPAGEAGAQPMPVGRTVQPFSRPATVEVLRSDLRGIVLRIAGLRLTHTSVGSGDFIGLNSPALATADSITLPGLALTVAIPPGARDIRATVESALSARFGPSPVGYRNGHGVGVSGVGFLRRLPTVVVTLQPVREEAGSLVLDTAFTVRLDWRLDATAPSASRQPEENRAVRKALSGLIVNYAQATSWRAGTSAMPRLMSASGWGMGEAVVMLIPRSGIYRVTGDQLFASGAASMRGSPIGRIGVSMRRVAVPIIVDDVDSNGAFDASDVLEFAAERNRARPDAYLDDITDTNAYVLTWDGRNVSVRLESALNLPEFAPSIDSYDSTLHFEQDNSVLLGYFVPEPLGGGNRSIYVSDRMPGEDLYWRGWFETGPFQDEVSFDCSPAFEPGGQSTLRVRFANNSPQSPPLRLILNGTAELGNVSFPTPGDTVITLQVPTHFLVNGRNTLRFYSQQPSNQTAALYMDWIELSGRWLTRALDGAPRLTLPAGMDSTQPRRLRLVGLKGPLDAAIAPAGRLKVDSTGVPGVLFRLTSRQYYQGGERINHGFNAEFGVDGSVSSEAWAMGISIASVDPSGRLERAEFFRTYASASDFDRAAAFIGSIPIGNFVIAGTSVGFGAAELPPALQRALDSLGSGVATRTDLDLCAWTIAARKGTPSQTREAFQRLAGPESQGVAMNAFMPSSRGADREAVLTVVGTRGQEIALGARATPELRYHQADALIDADNRADLIIITHPVFRQAAERLAAHRRIHPPDGSPDFAVKVVDVRTIYDEFNAGVKNPLAIRHFLQFADSNWRQPGPAYVLLMGDASFDPQQRLLKSAMVDYVPTNGEPASDYLFTVPFNGSDSTSPYWKLDTTTSFNQFIGRLPAMTPADADAMVDKIIDYDTLAPAAWQKRAVFIAGGGNLQEVTDNVAVSRSLAEYMVAPWFLGDTTIVYRRDITFEPTAPPHPDALLVQREMSKGALWVNSAGHGSRYVLDFDFGYPSDIDNVSRYFMLSTFSCQTGAFSDNERSLRNEDFVKVPRRGAIAAFGSTGWSYGDVNSAVERNFANLLTTFPYTTNLGALTTLSKWREFAPFVNNWPDSATYGWNGHRLRAQLLIFSLLGDPSMDLHVSQKRELAFESPHFSGMTTAEPAAEDSIAVLKVELHNYGRPVFFADADIDSVITVVARITDRDRVERYDTALVRWLAREAPVELHLPLDRRPGEYDVRVEIDPERQVDEGYRDDNVLALKLRVRGNQPLPLEPVQYGRVASYDDVTIHLLNPPTGPGADIVVDTTSGFDSPAAFSSADVGRFVSDVLTTTWTFSIPQQLRTAKKFWWKATATSGDLEVARMFPLIQSFTVEPAAGAEFMLGGVGQMGEADIRDLVNDTSGVGPGSRRVQVRVRAIGQSRYPNGDLILVDRIGMTIDVGSAHPREVAQDNAHDGLQILVLDSATLEPIAYGTFLMYYDPAQVGEFLAFVDGIPTGQPVLVGTNGMSFQDFLSDVRRDQMIAAMRSLGCTVAEKFGPKDSYVLIGGKGVPNSHEMWIGGAALDSALGVPPNYIEASVSAFFPIVPRPGTLTTSTIGPATAWRSVRIDQPDGSRAATVTVVGVRRDGRRDSLGVYPDARTIDLAGVDVRTWPRLELRAGFPLDSAIRVRSIAVDFDPSPEIAIVPGSTRYDKDSVLQGDAVNLRSIVANLSRRRSAEGIDVTLAAIVNGERRDLDSEKVSLAPYERREVSFPIETDRLGERNRFAMFANPIDQPAEPYRHNNADSAMLRVTTDAATPSVLVFADGHRLMDGDYVGPKATFELRMLDNSRIQLTDSTSIRMFLDLNEITADSGGHFQTHADGEHRASFVYTPPPPGLANGEHTITYQAVDDSGNKSLSEYVRFEVERGLRLDRVVNYPNPFVAKTQFTYMVIGSEHPSSGEIAIYTVAGRKIRTLRLTAADVHLGFNRVEWDGRDEEGDRLANGVYLYRLSIENAEGTRAEAIEKLVVMQ